MSGRSEIAVLSRGARAARRVQKTAGFLAPKRVYYSACKRCPVYVPHRAFAAKANLERVACHGQCCVAPPAWRPAIDRANPRHALSSRKPPRGAVEILCGRLHAFVKIKKIYSKPKSASPGSCCLDILPGLPPSGGARCDGGPAASPLPALMCKCIAGQQAWLLLGHLTWVAPVRGRRPVRWRPSGQPVACVDVQMPSRGSGLG